LLTEKCIHLRFKYLHLKFRPSPVPLLVRLGRKPWVWDTHGRRREQRKEAVEVAGEAHGRAAGNVTTIQQPPAGGGNRRGGEE
jgi:hypothetical protein